MLRFIIQTLIMLSFGAMLYLMAKALPRVSDEEGADHLRHSRLMEYLEKLDELLKSFFEKVLRRSRVWLLKLDNMITKKLDRFKKNGTKEMKTPLMGGEEKEEEEEK